MCRFLIANFQEEVQPEKFLENFATACEQSPHWQGDGWGLAWWEKDGWQTKKSLRPIWEDQTEFADLPASRFFLIHARGASFPKDKNNLDFNQPFIRDGRVFVFNGFLNGVDLPMPVAGKVGAEKIFNLVLQVGLPAATDTLIRSAKLVEALNVGLATAEKIAVFSHFTTTGDYHRLYISEDPVRRLICSVPFGDFSWQPLAQDKIFEFPVI